MEFCKSCTFPIDDLRTSKKCSVCEDAVHKECVINDDGAIFCDNCYTVRAQTPEKINFEIPDKIRRTYIELYRSCPHKFFLEVLEGNESPATCYTQVGIDLHDLFEKGVNDRSYPMQQMIDDFTVIWNNVYPSMELFDSEDMKVKMWTRAMESIETFYQLLPDIPIPFVTEETIRYSIGEDIPDVEFTMDVVTEDEDGGLHLHDWKTGKVMVGQKLSSDLQAPLYIYGVQEHYKRPVKSFTFYYLHENKVRVFTHDHDDTYVCEVGKRRYYITLTDTIKEVKRIFAQIKKGNFNIPHDTKKMYFACKMCHLPKMGLCSGADEESWYQLAKS